MDLLTITKCRHNLQHRNITNDTTVLQDVMATCRLSRLTLLSVRARVKQSVIHLSALSART